MKIAIISPWTISPQAIGGTERFVIDLAESFSELGHKVDVYMLSGKEYKLNNVNYCSINLFGDNLSVDEYFLKDHFNDFSEVCSYQDLATRIEKTINLNEYDLIHLNSQLFLKLCPHKKRIFTVHTNPFEYKMAWGRTSFNTMLVLMNQEGTNINTKFVTPSLYYAKEYQKLSGISVNYIPHAINKKRLLCAYDNEYILDKLKLDTRRKVILLPSRLEPKQKQPMLFMKAFSQIDGSIRDKFQVICTGADSQYDKYTNEIIKFCNLNGIILKIVKFKDMANAYKIASLVVLPSKSESFGYSALESLVLGIPTILNAIPTYKEIYKYSNNSYLFQKNVPSLVSILNKVLNSELKRITQNKEWQNLYNIHLFSFRYLQLFQDD